MVKIDFNEIKAKVTDFIKNFDVYWNKFVQDLKIYFDSLTQYEAIAWVGEGTGFVMLIIGLIVI